MITFYKQSIGYSHLSSGKPCQDNGDYFSEDGIHIVVVCDGHGSESYVRSQDGSKFAAEIALEEVKAFIGNTDSSLFVNKSGAVTAKPTEDLLKDSKGNNVEYSSLSESQQELVLQNKSYTEEVSKNSDVENCFRDLFKHIVGRWNEYIKKDSHERPFSEEEKQKLGSKRLQRAYGTTLMVAVRTPSYWFAFHIGDGKLLICDKLMQWSEPVPWDCRCFLNYTTSLCDPNPVCEFRYAFDGTGNFPIAFVLGSDGIDDTFIQPELLHKFYSQLLSAFNTNTKEEALESLRKFLPILSERGSHDDMSVAGIIDESELALPLKYYAIDSERRSINEEREGKKNELKQLMNEHITQLTCLEEACSEYRRFYIEVRKTFCSREEREEDKEKLSELRKKMVEKEDMERSSQELINKKEEELKNWIHEKKPLMNEHKKQLEELKNRLRAVSVKECEVKGNSNNLFTEATQTNDIEISEAKAMPPEGSEILVSKSDEQAKEILNSKNR